MESGLGIISWIIFRALAGWVASMIADQPRAGLAGEHHRRHHRGLLGGLLFGLLTGRDLLEWSIGASSWPSSGRWCCSSSCAWSAAPKRVVPNSPQWPDADRAAVRPKRVMLGVIARDPDRGRACAARGACVVAHIILVAKDYRIRARWARMAKASRPPRAMAVAISPCCAIASRPWRRLAPTQRVTILEFPSYEQALAWYHSPVRPVA